MNHSKNMAEDSILRLVLTMSYPMVLSMMVNALYNIVDSYFVASISEEAMTALSLVYPIQMIVNSMGVGFGIGINAMIAYHLGAGNQKEADHAASLGFLLSLIHGIVLMFLCRGILPSFLHLYTSETVLLEMGTEYADIVFLFAVVINVSIAMEKIFQSVGRMSVSMISMTAGCAANIILDPLMIFGAGPIPAMGIRGAAWATGIGQVLSLVIYIVIYFLRPMPVHIRLKEATPERILIQNLYRIGIPATLNMALPSLMISVLNGILASFSEVYVMVLGVYYKLQNFLYLTANGIVQGIRPVMSFNQGAQRYDRVEETYHTALKLAAGIMAFGMVLCLAIPEPLFGLFTKNEATIHLGVTALRIISFGFVASTISVITCGSLEALNQGPASLLVTLLRNVLLILPAAWILSRFFGPVGVWHAFWLTEIITGILSYLIYKNAVHQSKSS